ncbi:hypothetical protein H2202_005323 [Exophiala xenobiotica]|nr:hypothetical protein H2202_005323 [Exophiala xenobiotica]
MYWICSSVFILLALSRWTSADCVSYGVDYVDGGGPYCINTTSTDFFSFVSDFEGCQPSDSQGDITPILIDPNGDEYFCSDVATQPDDVDMTSTCNVTGNQVEKSQMFSGNWMIIVEGLTFAYMRTFDIIAGPPVTVTNTPTATFTVTNVPSTTITTTTTNVYSTTLPPSTVTVPSSTSTRTITTTPAQVTVYWTSTSTRTRTTRVWSSTVSTTTVTTTCKTQPPKKDPTCTIRPTKATLAAASNTANPVPRQRFRGAPRRDRPRDVSKHTLIEPRDGQLFKRGADYQRSVIHPGSSDGILWRRQDHNHRHSANANTNSYIQSLCDHLDHQHNLGNVRIPPCFPHEPHANVQAELPRQSRQHRPAWSVPLLQRVEVYRNFARVKLACVKSEQEQAQLLGWVMWL